MDKKYANYILSKTVDDYNKIGDKYSRVREKDWKEMEFLFQNYLHTGDMALDLGCGNGRFYDLFKKMGAVYFGMDNSEKMLSIAKNNHPEADFRKGSGLESVFPQGFFDKIFSIAVLHHIPSRALRLDFMKEARRILRDGGILILTVWDLKEKKNKGLDLKRIFKERKLERGDVLIPWYGAEDAYFHCFTLEELVQLTEEAGFKVIEKGEILVGMKPYSNFYVAAEK